MTEYDGVVIDASALLAYLFNEPGADLVEEYLASGKSVILTINYCETLVKLRESGITSVQLANAFAATGILDLVELVDFTPELAEEAANLAEDAKSLGLSLGDRACLALAKSIGAPAVTADRRWVQVTGVEIIFIRNAG